MITIRLQGDPGFRTCVADILGGITIGAERWNLAGCKWDGAEMTGTATSPVSDAEMARMFPDCGWAG